MQYHQTNLLAFLAFSLLATGAGCGSSAAKLELSAELSRDSERLTCTRAINLTDRHEIVTKRNNSVLEKNAKLVDEMTRLGYRQTKYVVNPEDGTEVAHLELRVAAIARYHRPIYFGVIVNENGLVISVGASQERTKIEVGARKFLSQASRKKFEEFRRQNEDEFKGLFRGIEQRLEEANRETLRFSTREKQAFRERDRGSIVRSIAFLYCGKISRLEAYAHWCHAEKGAAACSPKPPPREIGPSRRH